MSWFSRRSAGFSPLSLVLVVGLAAGSLPLTGFAQTSQKPAPTDQKPGSGGGGGGLQLEPIPADRLPADHAPSVLIDPNSKPNELESKLVPKKEREKVNIDAGITLIPRAVLMGNPERARALVSPDGTRVSFLAPVNGVLNIFVGPATDISKAQPVTKQTERGITQYFWAYTGEDIIFMTDQKGNENWHVNKINLKTSEITDLTPLAKGRAIPSEPSMQHPEELIVRINDRDPKLYDLYRLNIVTGDRTLLYKNETPGYGEFEIDGNNTPRFASRHADSGDLIIDRIELDDKGVVKGLVEFDRVPVEDAGATQIAGFTPDGKSLYMLDSRGENTAGLYEVDIATKKKKIILKDPNSDLVGIMTNPKTHALEAIKVCYDHESWTLIDLALQVDFYALFTQGKNEHAEMNVISRSADDRFWTVVFREDDLPSTTYLVDRGNIKDPKRKVKALKLFVDRPELLNYPLVPMHTVKIPTRDGLEMLSYLTLPLNADSDRDGESNTTVPMVLLVHGGPWTRDHWRMDPEAQLLANRGYAVLQVNYRGSEGFGKKHLNAGNLEWGGKMHEDLVDAVNWAIKKKITKADQVAIMGGSYGGYAALAGLTFTPDVFACGIDMVGPSNLNTFLSTVPAYWHPAKAMLTKRVGDDSTEEGKAFLKSRSPLTFVDKISQPLLIAQGKNDPRVVEAESEQIVSAMVQKKIPVTYLLYPDEGHGLGRAQNRTSYYAIVEAFLAQHLGGRAEPIGNAFEGSSVEIKVGADQIPGLPSEKKAAQ